MLSFKNFFLFQICPNLKDTLNDLDRDKLSGLDSKFGLTTIPVNILKNNKSKKLYP